MIPAKNSTPLAGRIAPRQTAVGLALAAAIMLSVIGLHVYAVFFYGWTWYEVVLAPALIALICWLDVGLFIVAHDAMHGSITPFRPELNRAIGRLCLALYAGFSFDRLIGKHFDHHRFSGTPDDPDFHDTDSHRFWPWYMSFLRRYFGMRELMIIGFLLTGYVILLGASPINVALFWGLPAILSSIQLFYFGTYLPHRHGDEPFGDRHQARSNDYGWMWSLLTCFHFGYHHEHHEHPYAPWWRLPRFRSAAQDGRA